LDIRNVVVMIGEFRRRYISLEKISVFAVFNWLLHITFLIGQDATRENSHTAYEKFVESAWESTRHCTLRGQLEFVASDNPINIDEVEPAKNIVKRFCTGII
jgi:glutamate synthase domain-containing protein 2